ncbi:SDR family oxidoreductase [Amorphus sp. 3PC139-8]|uniref:SDR family oxidoreductase n=1 Tax=Amorphus sp. 3PC139-8 TaxID=2735676 RepID=UPI00345DABA1
MRMSGNTILITGGGSGIGRALAHRFHGFGNTVIIAGRRMEALQEAVGKRPHMHAMTVDIENPKSVADFAERLLADYPQLNILVNNAGIMRFEALDRSRDLVDAEATISTNLLGPIRLTDALIEHLSAQNGATIINVSSGLAFVPLAAAPTYCATKAAIHSYTVAMREALAGHVEVLELVPPLVQTELTPGQSTRVGPLSLDEFIDEVMDLFQEQPTPCEIIVARAEFQRHAEAEHRFDEAVTILNARDRESRVGA